MKSMKKSRHQNRPLAGIGGEWHRSTFTGIELPERNSEVKVQREIYKPDDEVSILKLCARLSKYAVDASSGTEKIPLNFWKGDDHCPER